MASTAALIVAKDAFSNSLNKTFPIGNMSIRKSYSARGWFGS